eukprot:COSAG02_NODE_12483_length_1538_cov_11.364081_2_plen_92_part_00
MARVMVGQDGEGGGGSQEYLRDNNINTKADKKRGKAQISNASDAEASDALAQAQKSAKEDEREREPLEVRSYTQKVRINASDWADFMRART